VHVSHLFGKYSDNIITSLPLDQFYYCFVRWSSAGAVFTRIQLLVM